MKAQKVIDIHREKVARLMAEVESLKSGNDRLNRLLNGINVEDPKAVDLMLDTMLEQKNVFEDRYKSMQAKLDRAELEIAKLKERFKWRLRR